MFTVGELYLNPVGLSFATKVGPKRMVSMSLGARCLSNFAGNYLSDCLGSFYGKMPHSGFFVAMRPIGVVAGRSCPR